MTLDQSALAKIRDLLNVEVLLEKMRRNFKSIAEGVEVHRRVRMVYIQSRVVYT